jgi:hypothetical protein
LKDGVNVLGIGALKAKEKGKSVYLYMKIDAGLANLMYAFVNSPTETAPAFTNTSTPLMSKLSLRHIALRVLTRIYTPDSP